MIQLNDSFGKILLKKLQIGDVSNIHLNAASHRKSGQRMELNEIQAVFPLFPKDFLLDLFNDPTVEQKIEVHKVKVSTLVDPKILLNLLNKLDNIYKSSKYRRN
jgi:hypothetical protein